MDTKAFNGTVLPRSSRIIGVALTIGFALASITGAFAQGQRIIEGNSAEFYAGKPIESGTIVGTCNSNRSCLALKDACKTMKKHSYKTIEGGGICVDQANATSRGTFFLRNTNSSESTGDSVNKEAANQSPAAARRHGVVKLTKQIDTAEPALNCEGAVMCGKVKDICATLGGTYSRISDIEGTCQHQAAYPLANPIRLLDTRGSNEAKQGVTPRGWDPAKKTAATGSSDSNKTSGNLQIADLTAIAIDPNDSNPPAKRVKPAKPDLIIRQFLFPPTNDKSLRVHVFNTGSAPAEACRLILTVRKINGIAVGRQTHVNVPELAAGADTWLLIDAKSILPTNIKLDTTTFKLNVDATGIIPESNESNNEVWHNL